MASNELSDLTAEFQSYIVAPLNAFGLGGFVFDIPGEETTTLDADITDHYTEDNKAVQDHIARKPIMVTLKGYVGELTYKPDGEGAAGVLQSVVQKLTEVGAFLPTISTAATQLQSIATNGSVGFNEALSDASDIYGLVQNLIGATGDMANQQKAYLYFKACWQQGVLMGIQTPFEFLTNMAITNVTAIQTEGSTTVSDFSVRYKQMRFAKTATTAYSPGNAAASTGGIAGAVSSAASSITGAVGSAVTSVQDTVMQGVASLQSAVSTSIGPIPGVPLPSDLLPGSQALMSQANDLLANPNVAAIFKRAGAQ